MPFPSGQGTQAALRAMLDAECEGGVPPHLLCYGHGEAQSALPGRVHRGSNWVGDRSLKSGPSWRKVVQDIQLAAQSRRLHRQLQPAWVVAHHVEAAAAALSAGIRPVVFFAHTLLGPELPAYFCKGPLQRGHVLATWAGQRLDAWLARAGDRAVGLSPLIAAELSALSGREVAYVPVPWKPARGITEAERAEARRRFSFVPTDRVLLYAGNLDRYQGAATLWAAFARLAKRCGDAKLLVATRDDARAVRDHLCSLGCGDRLVTTSLLDETDRRAVHAAATLAVVPRAARGGLPIKLLDALSRGVPVVAQARATAGIAPLREAVVLAEDDDPETLGAAIMQALCRPHPAQRARGLAYLRHHHSPRAYRAGMDEALAGVQAQPSGPFAPPRMP